VKIKPKLGRHATLTAKDIFSIAERTVQIARRMDQPAQIMWFCRIPEKLGMGLHLPWYRAKQTARADGSHRRSGKIIDITKPDDLSVVRTKGPPTGNAALRLRPLPEFMRDNNFLAGVSGVATQLRLPVYLEGSSLGHAFYQLSSAGVMLICSGIAAARRTGGRRVFNKLVRDKIPIRIAKGGEVVQTAILPRHDFRPALIAKMLEETMELNNTDDEEAIEELADILEVFREIARDLDVKWDQIAALAEMKKDDRGGFGGRRVLLQTATTVAVADQSAPEFPFIRESLPEVPFGEIANVSRVVEGISIPWGVITTLSDLRNLVFDERGIRVRLSADSTGLRIHLEARGQEQLELPFELLGR
jgi:predicted house-cleaning noncanonical NTP pyrophosphatase (MazG superfamily)